MTTTDRPLRSKGAVDSLRTALTWLLDHPVLIGVFLAFGVINAAAQLSTALSLVSYVLSLFLGGIVHCYADRIVRNEVPELGAIAAKVATRMLQLIAIQVLYAVAVVVGFFLFVVPGIYLSLRLQLAFPACVIDDEGVLEGFSTSWAVARGSLLTLLGINLLGAVLSLLGVVLLSVLGGGLATAAGAAGNTQVLVFLIVGVVGAVVTPVVQLSIARVYLANRGSVAGDGVDEVLEDDEFDDAFRTV